MTGVKNIPKSLGEAFPPLDVPPGKKLPSSSKTRQKKKKENGEKAGLKGRTMC